VSDLNRRMEAARFAVSEACHVCRRVQQELERVRSHFKDDKSPVTVADFASQAVVARALSEQLGRITLVAEEAADELRNQLADGSTDMADAVVEAVSPVWPGAKRDEVLDAIDIGGADPPKDTLHGFWTLDPIDGTKGFLRNQQYAIALALVESGVPAIGVMGCPNLPRDMAEPLDVPDNEGCLYMALRGSGVWEAPCDDPEGEPIRMTRLDHARGDDICVCASVEKAHTDLGAVGKVLDHLRDEHGEAVGEPVRLDSQCKYAVVARGQADAYLRLPTRPGYVERIWDHAAGALIAAESGAAVTDIFGRDLDFTQGRGLEKNKGVVCAPPRLHGLLLGGIEAVGIGR